MKLTCRRCSKKFEGNTRHTQFCVPCKKEKSTEYSRKYRKENPEKVRENNRRWINENREKHNKRARDWRKRNPEYQRAVNEKWSRNNPERRREINRKSSLKWYYNNKEKALSYNKTYCQRRKEAKA